MKIKQLQILKNKSQNKRNKNEQKVKTFRGRPTRGLILILAKTEGIQGCCSFFWESQALKIKKSFFLRVNFCFIILICIKSERSNLSNQYKPVKELFKNSLKLQLLSNTPLRNHSMSISCIRNWNSSYLHQIQPFLEMAKDENKQKTAHHKNIIYILTFISISIFDISS